eukprot:TRINITY_DN3290_c0_g1_i1.p1 TRINITY_DN3290_c0_g1~~TRINITY_DN3290_c0_g1_i1.p1  ORF type:complete len:241 (-),score=69.05 TRINITY_DN3290_c0_g1_i1:231-896(-)
MADDKEAKAEAKAKKAEEKARAKVFDEKDEFFCGFMSLSIIDSDGYAKKTKGANMQGPLYMVSDGASGDPVVLETEFAMNPLFYLQVPNEDNQLLFGQWWLGEKFSELGKICACIPKLCQDAHKEMEKNSSSEFTLQAEMPLIRNSPSRLMKVTVTTKEQKFLTKVTKVSLQIPREAWTEFKNHRLKFWQYSKNQSGAGGGGGGGGDDKDDDEDKKKEESK